MAAGGDDVNEVALWAWTFGLACGEDEVRLTTSGGQMRPH